MKQEMMGWQWHQLDHMQIICTSLQTDRQPRQDLVSELCKLFYGLDALPDTQQIVSEYRKHQGNAYVKLRTHISID